MSHHSHGLMVVFYDYIIIGRGIKTTWWRVDYIEFLFYQEERDKQEIVSKASKNE